MVWLFASFLVLIIAGLLILTSASTAAGYKNFDDSYYFIKHQILFGLLPGIALFLLCFFINYNLWKKISGIFLFISLGFLILVFIPGLGVTFGKAKSWVQLAPFSFQPAEIVKLTFILYLSGWLSKRSNDQIKSFSYGFLPFVFLVGLIALLIVLQPDLGTLSIIIFTALSLYFVRGGSLKHIALFLAGGLGLFIALIKTAPYRADRLMTFLHPELDPQGIGYHINQAFLAIGSGGFWGRGFGHSRQKFQYLPETTGDSIFAVFAEEMGFLFSVLLIALFIFLLIQVFQMIKENKDLFAKLVATGIISWFLFQSFYNIASMIGILPMTGIPLIFISYGGTSLATSMAAFGLLLNIAKNTK